MFWVRSVYFNVRNILPKSGTFLPETSCIHSEPSYYMTANGQFHVAAPVPPEPTVVYREIGGNSGGVRVSFSLRQLSPWKPQSTRLNE